MSSAELFGTQSRLDLLPNPGNYLCLISVSPISEV
jgi:hypothetical protein